MAKPDISQFRKVLFVEGDSDLQFYKALFNQRVGNEPFIKNCQGRDQIKGVLEVTVNSGFKAEKTHVAVIVDADSSCQKAAESFAATLKRLFEQDIVLGGWTDGQPRVGLWIAPDCKSVGEVETLVWNAWSSDPANTLPKACVESFLTCMEACGHRPQSPHKGLVNALLAIENDDDPRLGAGARSDVFKFSRPEFAPLMEFLKGFGS